MSGRELRRASGLIAMFCCAWMALTFGIASAAEAGANQVPEEVWDRPRSGRTLLTVPAVRSALAQLSADSATRLVIRHSAGSESSSQAEELKAWLVAHAIGPERIALRSDLPVRRPLQLDVTGTAQP